MNIGFEKIKFMLGKKKNLYILLAVGILFLMCSNFFVSSEDKDTNIEYSPMIPTNENEEKRLEDLLSKIDGAGKTRVMITYDTGIEKITLQNSKTSKSSSGGSTTDSGGGKEETEIQEERQTVMNGSGNSQTPFIVKEVCPKVRGVLVVADGAGSEKVCLDLTNAVAAVLDVPYHRIKVLKKSN